MNNEDWKFIKNNNDENLEFVALRSDLFIIFFPPISQSPIPLFIWSFFVLFLSFSRSVSSPLTSYESLQKVLNNPLDVSYK